MVQLVMIYGNTWYGYSEREVFSKRWLKKIFAVSPFLFGKVILTAESDRYRFFTGTPNFSAHVVPDSSSREAREVTNQHETGRLLCDDGEHPAEL